MNRPRSIPPWDAAPTAPAATATPAADAHGSGSGSESLRWVPASQLTQQHKPQILAHLLSLDMADRIRRFGHAASDERIAHYVDAMDFDADALVGVFDRRLRLGALVHLAFSQADGDRTGTAEFGISVLPRLRGRGVGALLFEHAMTLARNRSVHTLLIHLARDNAPMLSIVQRAGATVDFEGSDAMATVQLPADTLGSQIQELIDRRAAEFDYRLKSNVLRISPAGWPGSL